MNIDRFKRAFPLAAIVFEISYGLLYYFLVSTNMTGSFVARKALACALMY
jgi:hypothetical protein